MANSSIQQNLIPNEPGLIDLLDLHRKATLLDLNCHHTGTIVSFDSTKQTASVTINYKKTNFTFNETTGVYDPVLENYPIIGEAPVICLGGGVAALTFPIQAGDECLVIFNDRDMDNWFVSGSASPNGTARLHSFADAIVLVGLRSLGNSLTNYDATRAVLKNGTAEVGVGPSLIKIANEMQTLKTVLEGLTAKIDMVLTTGTVAAAPGPVTFSGMVASYNPTIEELLE